MPAASCSAKIHVLPDDVVSRIAAGEVVERPAAVVKELLENSLDAGGLHITIDVKDGGLALIRVTDDGEGISRADLSRAFERHATSKLRSDRDLASVTTMGFRGEALPSIASVSHVLVTTATRQDSMGSQLTLVAGAGGSIVDAPVVHGTRIEVSNLFFNQPARKKFLKSTTTEFSHISHVVQLAGLAWPSVHFRLTHNGQEILNYPAVTADRDRILQVYRQTFLDRTLEVRGRIDNLGHCQLNHRQKYPLDSFAHPPIFHWRLTHDRGRVDGLLPHRKGRHMKHRKLISQGVIARVIAERSLQPSFRRVNVTLDDNFAVFRDLHVDRLRRDHANVFAA